MLCGTRSHKLELNKDRDTSVPEVELLSKFTVVRMQKCYPSILHYSIKNITCYKVAAIPL